MHAPIFTAALAAAVATWASPAQARLKVITTTTDLADWARAVGGDRVDVSSMAKGWQDPHFVEAKPSLMLALHQADLLIAVGLDLESGWLPGVIQGARNPAINPGSPGYLEGAEAIAPIEQKATADRREGDVHPRGNPHYWLDPENARAVVRKIGERLGQLDPEGVAQYRSAAETFSAAIDARLKDWHKKLAPFQGQPVVTYHKTLNYFYERFGLRGVGYVEPKPGIPPSPAHMVGLIRQMRAEKVKLILVESFYDPRVPQTIAEQAGAALKIVPVSVLATPEAKDYFALIDTLVSALASGLGGGK